MRHQVRLLLGALLVASWMVVASPAAHAAESVSPASPSFGYDAGPFTNLNVGGVAGFGCALPQGCDDHPFTVQVPDGYYAAKRAAGRVGAVQITATWASNADDFDLTLLNEKGDAIASSGFGNSDFERITFADLPSGNYTVEMAIFRAANASFHVDVSLIDMTPAATAAQAGDGGMAFSNGTPVALERSSGEPNMEIAPNNDMFVDIPLGAGTNSILYKSADNGDTWKPLAPDHPNNNPLRNNAAGGGDSGTAIDPDGRICFSELNSLISLGIGCSTDGGKTFPLADPLVIDPSTPLVDRQWQAATPQKEQFLAAQFGIVTVGPSQPGIRLFKEAAGSNVFTKVADIDTGKAMKSYNMAVDPTDADANGGTVVEAYLRSNEGPDKVQKPHELMVWSTTDGGTTIATHKVVDLATTPGNNFASVATDRAGNVYVAWSEQGTWDIFYSMAKKGALDTWTTPVRVNLEPNATTAIQPTIKVGDPGRVFIGFYGAEQPGNPDALPGGVWNAFVASSTNGACQLDVAPCSAPAFHQAQVTDHPVQFRGICLGGTGCSAGDPYYGDRSMLEYLDLAFSPVTGQLHVVVTDSSRSNQGTTITMYRQTAGPSAFAAAGSLASASTGATQSSAIAAAGDVSGVTRIGDAVDDPSGDGVWPYESPLPSQAVPGADITHVGLSRPDGATLRVTMQLKDPSALTQAALQAAGSEVLVGVRFATDLDVFWMGVKASPPTTQSFAAGHLAFGLVDRYTTDANIPVKGVIDQNGTITMDVPIAKLTTTLEQPSSVTTPAPVVPGVQNGKPLFAVTGISFAGVTSASDNAAKHWIDVAPAFTFPASANAAPSAAAATPTPSAPSTKLPATGGSPVDRAGGIGAVVALLASIGALTVRRRVGGVSRP